MKANVLIFTEKFQGAILKKNGYKLRNMPVHCRCDREDELNKYVKTIEVNDFNQRTIVHAEITKAQEILKEAYGWFECEYNDIGNTFMAYMQSSINEIHIKLWKKQ
jgi:hypothetical protein